MHQVIKVLVGSINMNKLCRKYDGFYGFAFLLERLAEGIANGTIPVPE